MSRISLKSNTRAACLLLYSFLLLSCQTATDTRYIARGDEITLNKTISIPPLQSHVIIQFGEIIMDNDLKPYATSCIVDNKDLGPVSFRPQRYKVSRIIYNQEMYSDAGATIRYFTEIILTADEPQQNIKLSCQVLGDTMQYQSFPTDVIQQVTGDFFVF